jgi:hypothetical protein
MRLYYHPESDALFMSEPGDWQQSGDGALSEDVTDNPKYRKLAVLDGMDLDDLTPEGTFVIIDEKGARDVPVEEFMEIKHGGMAGAIAASMAKWARKPADLYPTPVDCTYSVLPHIAHLVPVDALVLEPACADGQMVRPMREFGWNVDGTDLRLDVTGGTGGIDFLSDETYIPDDYYDLVATNPPFAAAELFIRRALQIAPVVVMLLKAQYWNTGNRKKLFRETKPYMELNLTWRPAFLEQERGNSPLMDCMWVVWVRGHAGPCTTTMIDRLKQCPVNVVGMDFGGL